MKFNQAVGCCTCSWPYFFGPHYISKKKGEMTEKPDFILVNPTQLSTLPSVSSISSDNADSLKSPNMSADSGFEGDNNRPSLLQPNLSLPKEEAICFWRKDVSDALEMDDPKKSSEDSDFNESPLDKNVPNDCDMEEAHSSTFSYCNGHCEKTSRWLKNMNLNGEENSFLEITPLHPQSLNLCSSDSSKDVSPSQELSPDREDALEKIALIVEDTSAAEADSTKINVPSTTKDSPLLTSIENHDINSSPSEAQACSQKGAHKYSRSQSEPTHYTTVVKPKAVKPSAVNIDRVAYRSSLDSLNASVPHSDVFSRRSERLSAFHERSSSSLSNWEDMHAYFSRSLETPPLAGAGGMSLSGREISLSASNGNLPSNRVSSLNDFPSSLQPYAEVILPPLGNKREVHDSKNSPEPSESSPVKRHSMPWDLFWSHELTTKSTNQYDPHQEPIHMTLEEVRTSLQTLDTSLTESESEGGKTLKNNNHPFLRKIRWVRRTKQEDKRCCSSKKVHPKLLQRKSFPTSLRAAFNNLFGLKKEDQVPTVEAPSEMKETNPAAPLPDASISNNIDVNTSHSSKSQDETTNSPKLARASPSTSPFTNRALPPLPTNGELSWEESIALDEAHWSLNNLEDGENLIELCQKRKMDYAASIEKVKDCGWYWGPISGEMAEKLLANEPDGSFVVRDSSDEHYIFSLTFKLNGLVRHVRIEHDHGNFSFGCRQKFRSNTIVDFIENAVEHSRSGRYLFFLHRRPVLGPMQVQLLHPVSRFKKVQSLQHLCRFVILKHVRKDLIDHLPLPRKLQGYLNTPHYYSENCGAVVSEEKQV